MALLLIFFFFITSTLAASEHLTERSINPKWNATKADKLKRDLLLNYDKFTRPSQSDNATVVTFDPTIHHIELDEEKGILTIHAWVRMTWTDEKLKWDADEYDGFKELHLADHEIWQPDIIPYNSASGSSIDIFGNTHCIVFNTGNVIWVPPAVFKVFCEVDLRKWPFDTQTCTLKVGSWTYSGMQIDLKYNTAEPDFNNLLPNAEWQFVTIRRERNSRFYSCCPEPYIDLAFEIVVQRKAATYEALLISPITAIVFMILTTYWLPVTSKEKILLGATNAVIISLFLIYFSQKIAVVGGNTPLVVKFYTTSFYLVAFSIITSVIGINLATKAHTTPLPWFLKSHLTGWLGRILLLSSVPDDVVEHSMLKYADDDNRPLSSDGQGLSEGETSGNKSLVIQHEWRLLATAIDRICFIIYCILFIVFAAAYSV